jgi:hypothetical protein
MISKATKKKMGKATSMRSAGHILIENEDRQN